MAGTAAGAAKAKAERARVNGQFVSQTASRITVDEGLVSTVTELADGSKLLTAGPSIEELPGGVRIITAIPAAGDGAGEDEVLAEPLIFTNPTQPNLTLAGSMWKIGPGKWRQEPKSYLRFINGHCAARTRRQADRVRRSFPTKGSHVQVWEEPAPLLNEAEAEKRGLPRLWLFKDSKGAVLFWTYHPAAYMAFQQAYLAQRGD